MSMIDRKIIRFTNNDVNIKFNIDSNIDEYGYQQEIDNLTQFTAIDLINPVTDNEVIRFKSNNATLNFYFQNQGGAYDRSFIYAGFSTSDIANNSESYINSFFVLDLYDSYDINTQRKITTQYLTKFNESSSIFYLTTTNPIEFNYIKIPRWFLDSITGLTTSINVYMKLSFYCALNNSNGGMKLFYGYDRNTNSSLKMFTEIELDISNKIWRLPASNLSFYEVGNAAERYINKINDTFENYDNIKQNFPNGNTFNSDGDYSIV